MGRNNAIEKHIDLSNLPRGKHNGGSYDWTNSIGCKIKGIFDGVNFEVEIKDYIKDKQILFITYKGAEYSMRTGEFTRCSFGKILNIITSEFKYEIGQIIKDDKRDIIITDKKKIQSNNGQWMKFYKYNCNMCGFDCGKHYSSKDKKYKDELWINENHLNNKRGCSCCSNSTVVVEDINSLVTTAPWMVKYFVGGYDEAKMYTRTSSEKIVPICPDCGRVKDRSKTISDIYKNKHIGCICRDKISKPNKVMYCLLAQLNISFISEYSPDWIGLKRYDFYVPSKNIIIEMDGGWHTNDNNITGKTKEESKAIDDYKDEQAILHGIEVIRIDCDYGNVEVMEHIKKSLLDNKKFNNIFDLSNIKWDDIYNFITLNLAKIVCEYKENEPNLTTTDISNIMNNKISPSRVRNFLKQGSKLGWCYYNEKEESSRVAKLNNKKIIQKCSKKVEVFKGGISLGVFISIMEIERQSEKLFGVKLSSKHISSVCKGKRKSHGGFTFKYA